VRQDLGVAAARERVPIAPQLASEIGEVIELAVLERHHERSLFKNGW
jgi:hypothetical protein